MLNETLSEVLDKLTVGTFFEKIILYLGGIATITLIYFFLMVYYQRKIYIINKENKDKIDKIYELVGGKDNE